MAVGYELLESVKLNVLKEYSKVKIKYEVKAKIKVFRVC